MTQQLIKTDTVFSNAKPQNYGSGNEPAIAKTEAVDKRAFSNELDKQIQRGSDEKNISKDRQKHVAEKADSTSKSEDKAVTKAEKTDNEDGKKLPEVTDKDTEQTEGADKLDVTVAETENVELELETADVENSEASETEVELVSTVVSLEQDASEQTLQSQTKSDTDTETASTGLPLAMATETGQADKKAATPLVKSASQQQSQTHAQSSSNVSKQTMIAEAVEESLTKADTPVVATSKDGEQDKKPLASIRPDILDALGRKKSQQDKTVDTFKAVVTTDKNVQAEGRQMAELIKQVQPGLNKTEASTAKGFGQLVNALTPAAANPSMTASASSVSSAATVTSLDIQPNLNSAAWERVMSSRVVWMAKEGIQQAQLKLNPANLGPVEVRLHIHNDQASVSFLAQHAMTREALEQALPRLRESFAENGLALSNAEVSEQNRGDGQQQEQDGSDDTGTGSQTMHASENVDAELEQEATLSEDDVSVGVSLYA